MTRTQGIGSLAAIGGLTALIALQTGLPAAKADEMADLRANQLLLQQRIDQLAQARAGHFVPHLRSRHDRIDRRSAWHRGYSGYGDDRQAASDRS